MFQKYSLDNKADVILVPSHDTQSVTTLVMYPVGSRYESDKMQGVAHFIEHMMFKGTEKRKNTLALTREIDRLGAEYNAFTGKEYTGYYIQTAKEYLKLSLDILSDMLFHSKFDPKEMEREKGPIIEELKMYKDNPTMNIDTIFDSVLFKGCPLERDIGGTEKHVAGFKRDDVLKFKQKYYNASNVTLVIAGNIDEKVYDWVKEYFGKKEYAGTQSRGFKELVLGPANKKERIKVDHKTTDQVQMMLGFPSFDHKSKERRAMTVLNTILGGSMSSRLFIRIRERHGLAYSIRSGNQYFRDGGYTYIQAGLDPKNVNKAIEMIKDEIEKIMTKGITKRELKDAKTHLRGSVTLALEDSSSQANWYAKQALFMDEVSSPEDYLEEIDNVSYDDVIGVAKKVFKMNQMRVAIIGNVTPESVKF